MWQKDEKRLAGRVLGVMGSTPDRFELMTLPACLRARGPCA